MFTKRSLWAGLVLVVPVWGLNITVRPGQSIQAAIDGALPGDQVTVLPGTYHEAGRPCPMNPNAVCAVSISMDSISLIAKSSPGQLVILENPGGQDNGIVVARQGADGKTCRTNSFQRIVGSRVEGFVVRNFASNGILLFCVDNWTVQSNTAVDNAEYGIFPLYTTAGRLSMNTASGSHDTGIYIGQSSDARVDNNLAHDNLSGFEVENSADIEVDHNVAIHNTAGILMFILPEDAVLVSRGNRLHHNFVYENNSPNTCLDPNDDVCMVAPGIGILAVGGDHNQIDHNQAIGNQTFGIALSDVCTAFQLAPNICSLFTFSAKPQMTRIESNSALGNGNDPKFPGQPGADLIWSSIGKGNCWDRNTALMVSPAQLPVCE